MLELTKVKYATCFPYDTMGKKGLTQAYGGCGRSTFSAIVCEISFMVEAAMKC